MLKPLTALTLLIIVAAVMLGCTQGDKHITLRFKYRLNETLMYEQTFKRNVKVVENDSTVKDYSSYVEASIEQRINDVFDDGSVQMTEIDTWRWEEPSKEDSTVMKKMEETQTLSMKVEPNGRVYNIEFPEDESQTRISYIKDYYEQGMPNFPSYEISPGDSWTQTVKVMLPDGVMEASTTYRVRSLAREAGYDCAVIEIDGNLIIPLKPDPMDSVVTSGIDRIQSTGKLYFAYKEGIVVLQRERWVIDGDRKKTCKEGLSEYKVAVEIDTEFKLTKRSVKI